MIKKFNEFFEKSKNINNMKIRYVMANRFSIPKLDILKQFKCYDFTINYNNYVHKN